MNKFEGPDVSPNTPERLSGKKDRSANAFVSSLAAAAMLATAAGREAQANNSGHLTDQSLITQQEQLAHEPELYIPYIVTSEDVAEYIKNLQQSHEQAPSNQFNQAMIEGRLLGDLLRNLDVMYQHIDAEDKDWSFRGLGVSQDIKLKDFQDNGFHWHDELHGELPGKSFTLRITSYSGTIEIKYAEAEPNSIATIQGEATDARNDARVFPVGEPLTYELPAGHDSWDEPALLKTLSQLVKDVFPSHHIPYEAGESFVSALSSDGSSITYRKEMIGIQWYGHIVYYRVKNDGTLEVHVGDIKPEL